MRLIKENIYLKVFLIALIYFAYINLIELLLVEFLSSQDIFNFYFIYKNIVFAPLLFILIFKLKGAKIFNDNKIVSFKIHFIPLIILGVVFFRIFEDPFFRYQNIIVNQIVLNYESTPKFSYIDEINIFIYYTLLGPIVEELLFRKYFISFFEKKKIKKINIIVFTSLLFAATHITFPNVLLVFFFGIILSIVYLNTKNIIYPIVIHCTFNLLWYLIRIYDDKYWEIIRYFNFNYLYWLIVILSTFSLILIMKKVLKMNEN